MAKLPPKPPAAAFEPPHTETLEAAMETMRVLQDRLAAAERRAAAASVVVEAVTETLEDELAASGKPGQAGADLASAEDAQRIAKAEAAGLRRRITSHCATLLTAAAACETANIREWEIMARHLDGRVRAAATHFIDAMTEATIAAYAVGRHHDASAFAQVRVPLSLGDAGDLAAWRGAADRLQDGPPLTTDAITQLEGASRLVREARMAADHGGG